MKYFSLVFSVLLLSLFNVVTAGLVSSWSNQHSYTPSHYFTKTRKSNVNIIDCSDETYVLNIESIKISPEIVTPGCELTIEASGTLSEPVTPGSNAHVTVKLGVVTLLRKTFDLCDELEKKKDEVELQCPINNGRLKVVQKVTLPKEVPKAKFVVAVEAYTADDYDLACLRVMVDFRVHHFNKFLQLSNSD